jgi:hypothetical protein
VEILGMKKGTIQKFPQPVHHVAGTMRPWVVIALTCSCSKTSAALLKNIAPALLTLLENIAGVLLTFGKNVLRLW